MNWNEDNICRIPYIPVSEIKLWQSLFCHLFQAAGQWGRRKSGLATSGVGTRSSLMLPVAPARV